MAEAQTQGRNTSEVTSSFQALNINEEKNINVLLLGPSKAGMSTFVNAFANYLTYRNLDSAEKGKLVVVVPSSYTIIGKDTEEHEVQVVPELSEDDSCDYDSIRTYSIPLSDKKTKLHMICVPAVENPFDEDAEDNGLCYEDILSYIAQTEILHAICCVCPVYATNDSILNLFFEQCFHKLLSRLSDQVYKNLIFLYTHSQATYYTAGSSLSSMKKFLNSPENSDLQQKVNFEGKNTFYFENNSFMYLAACQKKIEFDVDVKKRYNETWNHSYKESLRFIDYITGSDSEKSLTPYSVSDNISVVMTRWLIIKMLQPIADILDLIKNNVSALQEHLEFFDADNLTLQDVEEKLNMPAYTLKVTSLPQPVTMCANGERNKCAIYHTVGNIQTWRMERCCERCYLRSPPRYLIGDISLLNCDEMEAGESGDIDYMMCRHCGCSIYDHMHMYYKTTLEKSTNRCESPQSRLLSEQIQQISNYITNRITAYEYEMKLIVNTAAEFVHFLQNEAIAPYNDPFEMYLQYLINREEVSGNVAGERNILGMSSFLVYYNEMKETLTEASDLCKRLGDEICLPLGKITPEKVVKSIDVLYGLKHTGSKIKELVESQSVARTEEYRQTVTEITLCYSKDMEHNSNAQNRFQNRRNRNKDGGYEHGDDRSQRGNFRGRGNRGRYGGNRGNFHQNFNMQQPNTNKTEMSQPPPYSQLYPNNCEVSGNFNPQQPTKQPDFNVPYVQINVINDSASESGSQRQTDSYTCNQGRGGYRQQAGRGFKPNRGGYQSNQGNRPWNRQNRGSGQQNTGFQRHQPPADKQNQSTDFNMQSNKNMNQQKNTRSNQNQFGNNQQRRAAGSNQQQNTSSGHQQTGPNQQQKSKQYNQAGANQRQNTNQQSRTVNSQGVGSNQRQNTNQQRTVNSQGAGTGQQQNNQQYRTVNSQSAGSGQRQYTNEQHRTVSSQGPRTNALTNYQQRTQLSQQTIRSYANKKEKSECVVM